jgi:hypothetical protein
MSKVKAQLVRRNQGAFLLNMLTEVMAQGGMQQMRRTVMSAGVLPTLGIHHRPERLFGMGWLLVHPVDPNMILFEDIQDFQDLAVLTNQTPRIPYLPTGFGIKRRNLQNHLGLFGLAAANQPLPKQAARTLK